MSDFAGDIDAEPGERSLPSWVHLDMSDFADSDSVSQVCRSASVSVNRGPGRSPQSPGM